MLIIYIYPLFKLYLFNDILKVLVVMALRMKGLKSVMVQLVLASLRLKTFLKTSFLSKFRGVIKSLSKI